MNYSLCSLCPRWIVLDFTDPTLNERGGIFPYEPKKTALALSETRFRPKKRTHRGMANGEFRMAKPAASASRGTS